MKKSTYTFKTEVWLYPGETANWYFVTVPKKQSGQIKKNFGERARGWGSLPVEVTVGKSRWTTSIFPDKKSGSYLLPIKANIRKKEAIEKGDRISFLLYIKA